MFIEVFGVLSSLTMATTLLVQDPPPISAYTAEDTVTDAAISPDGQRLATLSQSPTGERVLLVTTIGDPRRSNATALPEDEITSAVSVNWLDNDYIAVDLIRRQFVGAGAVRRNVGGTMIFSADGEQSYTLPAWSSIYSERSSNPGEIVIGQQEILDDRDSVRARRGREDGFAYTLSLYRHNLARNTQQIMQRGAPDTAAWVLDENGEAIFHQEFDDEGFEYRLFQRNGGGFDEIYSAPFEYEYFGRNGRRPISEFGFVAGLAHEGDMAWFAHRVDRDMLYASIFDPADRSIIGPEINTGGSDLSGFISDWRTNRIIGLSWYDERRFDDYYAQPWAGIQGQLQQAFPDSHVSIVDWDENLERFIVLRVLGGVARRYYLLDRVQGQISQLADGRPDIPNEWVAQVRPVHYRAQDGLELFGYLTLPPGQDPSDLPLVMLPHGGPEARDYYEFDDWSQIIASRGYAVFQPQFRGSDGFGLGFVREGHGEWGRAMQTDLTDAIDHLATEGIIDPERVCIFGWSYGGYAALAAATFQAEQYRCVIAGASVTDIMDIMEYAQDFEGSSSVEYWTEYIGDWRNDSSTMRAISPSEHADQIQAPVLMFHGTEDTIVPIRQSEIMARALADAGVDYEYIEIEGGPHISVLMTEEHQTVLYENLLRFLQTHNPPN